MPGDDVKTADPRMGCAEQEQAGAGISYGICSSQAVGGSCPKPTIHLWITTGWTLLTIQLIYTVPEQQQRASLPNFGAEKELGFCLWQHLCFSQHRASQPSRRAEMHRQAEAPGWRGCGSGTTGSKACSHCSPLELRWKLQLSLQAPQDRAALGAHRHNEPWLSQESSAKCRGCRTRNS